VTNFWGLDYRELALSTLLFSDEIYTNEVFIIRGEILEMMGSLYAVFDLIQNSVTIFKFFIKLTKILKSDR